MSELTQITKRLADFDVAFVIAGGLATILHGSALMTRDVDVACEMTPENLLRVWQALDGLNPVHRMSSARPPFTREQATGIQWKNLYLSTDMGQLDLLGEITGIGDYNSCKANSEKIVMDSNIIQVLTIDALISAKRALGRPKDLHAVLELEVIRARRQQ